MPGRKWIKNAYLCFFLTVSHWCKAASKPQQQSVLCKEVPITEQEGDFAPHPWTTLTRNLDFHVHLPPHYGDISRPICVQWLLKGISTLNWPWHYGKKNQETLIKGAKTRNHPQDIFVFTFTKCKNELHRNFIPQEFPIFQYLFPLWLGTKCWNIKMFFIE